MMGLYIYKNKVGCLQIHLQTGVTLRKVSKQRSICFKVQLVNRRQTLYSPLPLTDTAYSFPFLLLWLAVLCGELKPQKCHHQSLLCLLYVPLVCERGFNKVLYTTLCGH